MRTPAANKSVARANRCPKCGQNRTTWGCRTVEIGNYCVSHGLYKYHDGFLRPPAPDPIGPAEQSVIEVNTPLVAEAEKVVDAALNRHDAAAKRQFAALVQLGQAGVEAAPGAPYLAPANGRFDQHLVQRKRATPKQAATLRAAEEHAREDKADAEAVLSRARTRLGTLERGFDMQRRRARETDRGQA